MDIDSQHIFNAVPGLYLVLAPDSPRFTILAATDDYLRATRTRRSEIVGHSLLEVCSRNPESPEERAAGGILASLEQAILQGVANTMPVQRPESCRSMAGEGDGWMCYCGPRNTPVFDESGKVAYLIHRVEEVNGHLPFNRKGEGSEAVVDTLMARVDEMEVEIDQYAQEIQVVNHQLSAANECVSKQAIRELRESEERYRELVENANSVILRYKKDGIVTFFNEYAQEFFGYREDEIIGRSINLLVPQQESGTAEFSGLLRDIVVHPERYQNNENENVCRDGRRVWMSWTNKPILDAHGEVVEILSVGNDITVHKRMEEALCASQAKLEAALGSMTDAVFIADAQGHFIDFNNAFAVFHKFKNIEECPKTLAQYPGILEVFMANGEPAPPDKWPVPRALHGETAVNAEYLLRRKDTGETWVGSYSFSPIRDKDGAIAGAVVSARDVTERKRMEVYRETGREILQILNDPGRGTDSYQCVVDLLRERTEFDAVGIRLQEGDDFPYVAHKGFSQEFLQQENSLLGTTANGELRRDEDGNPRAECTCGLVLSGRIDPASPFFTPAGSFWCNDTSSLLHIPPGKDLRFRPRNQCIYDGYASMALVPIRDKERIVGLVQFNDRRKDCFTVDSIHILEAIASHIGAALMRKQATAALRESESKYRALFENMTNGFALCQVVVDAGGMPVDYIFREVNDAFEKHTGLKAADVLNKNVTHVLPGIEKDPADWIGIYGKVALTGREIRFEQYSESLRRWYAVIAYRPIRNFFAVEFEDITESKREEEVQSSLAAIVTSAEDAIISSDLQGVIQTWNVGAENIFGYTAKEVIGRNVSLLVPPGHAGEVSDILKHEPQNEEVENYESLRLRKDGTIIPVFVTVSVMKDTNGRVVGALRIAHDITRRKRAERLQAVNAVLERKVEERTRELQETQKQYLHAEKLSAIGKLSASIAHEFNNPLQGILSILKGLKRRAVLEKEDRELLEAAIDEGDRIKELVRSLRDFNRPSTGRKSLMDVHKSLDSILLLHKSDFNKKRISVVRNYAAPLPMILVVPDQIKQVLLNLLINAMDACQQGGEVITISTWREEKKVAVAIKDTGIGINPADMGRIFQPFYSTKGEVKGTGLGLSVSHGIVKNHQGEIMVDSQPGQGATFTILLPIEEVRSAAETSLP